MCSDTLDKNARDIMTHRKNIVAIDERGISGRCTAFYAGDELFQISDIRGSIDEIIGFMHLREAMTCYLKNNYRNRSGQRITCYIRPVDFIPEY